MTKIVYEDIHPHDGGYTYTIPNENIAVWRDIVKNLPVHKAAGICSSGEIGLFSILPSIKGDLVLVDHSYGSLYVALIKYLLIKEKGADEAYRLFTAAPYTELKAAIEEVRCDLPDGVNPSVYSDFDQYNSKDIGNRWMHQVPKRLVKRSRDKANRVKFIHGDLSDLKKEGPFGLLYLSNAFEHGTRRGGNTGFDYVEDVVKPGGFVCCAINKGYSDDENPIHKDLINRRKWDLVERMDRQPSDKTSINWQQTLYRIPA